MSNEFIYDGDLTGKDPAYRVVNEQHIISEISEVTNNVLVPFNVPFFPNDFEIGTRDAGGVYKPLDPEKDFEFMYPFYNMEKETGKLVYAGVKIHRKPAEPIIYISYQKLSGKFQANREKLLEALANYVYNPRIIQFDQLTDVQETFPPNQHQQDLKENYTGWDTIEKQMGELLLKLADPQNPTLAFQQQILTLLESNERLTRAYSNVLSDLGELRRRVEVLERHL